jgi:hypothetical protein
MSSLMRIGLAPLAALALVTGCATTPTADVTRFHLGQPIPHDSLAVVPGAGIDGSSLEFRSYANDVARQFAALGFPTAANPAASAYIVTVTASQSAGIAPPKSSGLSIGFGGATGGSGGGMAGGVSVPVGGSGLSQVFNNQVALQMKRRSDNSIVWEGRANMQAAANSPNAPLTAAVPLLTSLLLRDFPGPSGQTLTVKLPQSN